MIADLVTDLPDGAQVYAFRSREIQVAGEPEVRLPSDGDARGTVTGGRLTLRINERTEQLDEALALGSDLSITVLPTVNVQVTFNPTERNTAITQEIGGQSCPRCEGSPAAFRAGTATDSPSTWLRVSQSLPVPRTG